MGSAEKALIERIKHLRRRHFGAGGKAEFARRLDLALEEYERFERGRIPPGDIMLRMCELTGEDLQWLLTGVAARGTVVISGTRGRHQDLLARLAKLLDDRPALAAPLEAFVELLVRGAQAERKVAQALPVSEPLDLIPIFEADELPDELPAPEANPDGGQFWLVALGRGISLTDDQPAELTEPASEGDGQALQTVRLVSGRAEDGCVRRFVRSREVARCFPGMFGVRLGDDTMAPMFQAGDAVLATVGEVPEVGQPVLCKLAGEPAVRCRIWLGQEEQVVHLGRFSDGGHERVPCDRLRWSVEVLYRLSLAA
jgi:hypothetical protein